ALLVFLELKKRKVLPIQISEKIQTALQR
ncbi:3'-5' exonuclease domain-containing protein 2, partial [Acinetobacter baumannii]|nr:3'-5' exonuclease domain-containing protein 2 [Acinetobacter baumannii]